MDDPVESAFDVSERPPFTSFCKVQSAVIVWNCQRSTLVPQCPSVLATLTMSWVRHVHESCIWKAILRLYGMEQMKQGPTDRLIDRSIGNMGSFRGTEKERERHTHWFDIAIESLELIYCGPGARHTRLLLSVCCCFFLFFDVLDKCTRMFYVCFFFLFCVTMRSKGTTYSVSALIIVC